MKVDSGGIERYLRGSSLSCQWINAIQCVDGRMASVTPHFQQFVARAAIAITAARARERGRSQGYKRPASSLPSINLCLLNKRPFTLLELGTERQPVDQ